MILLGIAEASRFWWLRRRAACGKYGKYGKFSASFCGRRTNSEKDCYGNYTASRAQPVKTFRTFRSATAQRAASAAASRSLSRPHERMGGFSPEKPLLGFYRTGRHVWILPGLKTCYPNRRLRCRKKTTTAGSVRAQDGR